VARELLVDLPPSYAAGTRRFPVVVMVLTGYAATQAWLLNFKPWEPNELCFQPRFVEGAPVYERYGGAGEFVQHITDQTGPRSRSEFEALEFVALAAAYAPLESGPLPRAALPFDPTTAMILPETWTRWLAHDPPIRPERDPKALTGARLVFLDAGKSDEYGLQFGARMLAKRLMNSGARVHHEEFEGGHMGTGHRCGVSLPKILSALEGASLCQPL
jgi:enterochelin esterase family protein